ncbi:MAG: spondin domain-containing protein [Planctomycetota bacterium]
MQRMFPRVLGLTSASLVALSVTSWPTSSAHAQADGDIQITVTNEGNSDFFLTPTWFGFHNGLFDFFDAGSAASASLELIAEDGIVDGLVADFTAAPGIPGDIQGVAANPAGFGGAPVIDPGETATGFVTPINPANYQYFSFASMVIPSNDTFIGNDNPFAYQVFNAAGELNDPSGVFTIQVFGDELYDAGTEVNDTLGAAFAAAGGVSSDENGVVTLGPDLSNFTGAQTAAGTTINDLIGSNELLATITISIVPEPASAGLLMGSGLLLAWRRRRA